MLRPLKTRDGTGGDLESLGLLGTPKRETIASRTPTTPGSSNHLSKFLESESPESPLSAEYSTEESSFISHQEIGETRPADESTMEESSEMIRINTETDLRSDNAVSYLSMRDANLLSNPSNTQKKPQPIVASKEQQQQQQQDESQTLQHSQAFLRRFLHPAACNEGNLEKLQAVGKRQAVLNTPVLQKTRFEVKQLAAAVEALEGELNAKLEELEPQVTEQEMLQTLLRVLKLEKQTMLACLEIVQRKAK